VTNIFLAAITALLVMILTVLFRHIPKGEWIAAVKWWLKLFWALLVAMSPLSTVVVLVGVWARVPHPTNLPPVVLWGIPMAFLALSVAPLCFLFDGRESWWKRLKLSVQWTLAAFALLLFSWWDTGARLWQRVGFAFKLPLLENLAGAIIVTGGVAVYLISHGWRELGR
jgi:hypothetical protein